MTAEGNPPKSSSYETLSASQALQVLIPYPMLLDLLHASERVEKLQSDIKSLSQQNAALRSQFLELMEAFNDLRKYVID